MSHIKTAYEYGIKKALEDAGYSSVTEIEKQAKELGILPDPQAGLAKLLPNLKK